MTGSLALGVASGPFKPVLSLWKKPSALALVLAKALAYDVPIY